MIDKFSLQPKDIVLANPEYVDQKEQKVRPLLIISKALFHHNSNFVVCVGITTSKEKQPYLIPISKKQIEGGELDFDSQVMCTRIISMRQDKLNKKIARITPELYKNVMDKLKNDVLEL